jgi:serine/arginine repetitive matrix protein 2
VVDSIQAPRPRLPSPPTELRTDVVAGTPADTEPSSATRRKNALARALFGASDSEQSLTSPSPQPMDGSIAGSGGLSVELPPQIESSVSSRSLRETLSPSFPSVNAGVSSPSAAGQRDKDNRQELAKEVQRKAEAAMAQLKKVPSSTKVNEGSNRKRIDPSQISGPKLVSASTSVDTFPVRSPSAASGQLPAGQTSSSKLGSRFKKLRGSLRSKPTLPLGDGSTLHPFDQTSSADRSLAGTPDGPPPFSATEPTRSKVMPQPHPATAGPSLKGFVSRFLKPRSGDTPEHERRKQTPTSSSPATPLYFAHQQAERHPEVGNRRQIIRSAPSDNKSFRPHTPVSPESPLPNPPPSAPPAPPSVHHDAGTARDVDDNALKQFIDAANNLGLDQTALTEFLNRSTSISSRRLTAHSSKHMSTASIGHDKSNPTLVEPVPLLAASDRVGQPSPRPSGEFVGKAPVRRPLARKPDANAAIVRRTLIFPSEAKQSTLDPGTALRKSSSTRRRRSASATSMHSNRSLHDRAPTPPPPKTGRRFSSEQSPPLPHIPNSLLSQTEAVSNVSQSSSAIPLEKSNSAYDSL